MRTTFFAFAVLLVIVFVFFRSGFHRSTPSEIQTPYKGAPLTGSFECPLGDYGQPYGANTCAKIEKLARAGYHIGSYRYDSGVTHLMNNPTAPEDCDLIPTLDPELGTLKANCLSHFPKSLSTDEVCKRALDDWDVLSLIAARCFKGEKIERRNGLGQTILHSFALKLHKDTIAVRTAVRQNPESDDDPIAHVLSITPDVNAKDKEGGNTALHYTSDQPFVKFCLSRGCDPGIRNDQGETPLISWCKSGHDFYMGERVYKRLREAGLDVNATDSEGHTALYYLVRNGGKDWVIKDLSEAGAIER